MRQHSVVPGARNGRDHRVHVLSYISIGPSLHRLAAPLVRRSALFLARREANADGQWLDHLADGYPSIRGMRLGKYDKAVGHNRHLLESVYWGTVTRNGATARARGNQRHARSTTEMH